MSKRKWEVTLSYTYGDSNRAQTPAARIHVISGRWPEERGCRDRVLVRRIASGALETGAYL